MQKIDRVILEICSKSHGVLGADILTSPRTSYFRKDYLRTHTNLLVCIGLIEIVATPLHDGTYYTITEAGRKALKEESK